jgi:hypothetical protein
MELDYRTRYWWSDVVARWEALRQSDFPTFVPRDAPFELPSAPTLVIPFWDAEKRPGHIEVSKEEIMRSPDGLENLLRRKMRAA